MLGNAIHEREAEFRGLLVDAYARTATDVDAQRGTKRHDGRRDAHPSSVKGTDHLIVPSGLLDVDNQFLLLDFKLCAFSVQFPLRLVQ